MVGDTDAPTELGVKASTPRIRSLDWVRGLMLVVSVAVNSWMFMPKWFDHAPWIGVHPLDLVFPTFVTLSGCGLAFAYRRRVTVGPTVRRVVILFVVGLLYNVLATPTGLSLGTLRIPGVLQLYSGVVLVIALAHLVLRSFRAWFVASLALAGAHTVLLATWASSCASGALTPECNPSGTIDRAVFGASHIYVNGTRGHDPEGLVAMFGACICAAAGAAVGHAMIEQRHRRARGVPAGAILPVLLFASVIFAVGVLLETYVPAMKRLWTAPFALQVSAGTAVALLVGHLILDRDRPGKIIEVLTWPQVSMGRNSLFVYFGSHALVLVLALHGGAGRDDSWERQAAQAVAIGGHLQLTWTVLLVTSWMALAMLLHWRKIYLRP